MKQIEIKSTLSEIDFNSELSKEDQELMVAAREAVPNAYAPYSNYKVGAAVRLDNGVIVPGNNQENAVYPLGLCAERVALFNAGAMYPDCKPVTLAITIASENKPGFPCGSCRQAMIEFEQRFATDLKLIIDSKDGKVLIMDSAKDILPFSFDQNNLS